MAAAAPMMALNTMPGSVVSPLPDLLVDAAPPASIQLEFPNSRSLHDDTGTVDDEGKTLLVRVIVADRDLDIDEMLRLRENTREEIRSTLVDERLELCDDDMLWLWL